MVIQITHPILQVVVILTLVIIVARLWRLVAYRLGEVLGIQRLLDRLFNRNDTSE